MRQNFDDVPYDEEVAGEVKLIYENQLRRSDPGPKSDRRHLPGWKTLDVSGAQRNVPILLAKRPLEQSKPSVLAGSDGAVEPFFPPDGQWIGFFADQSMKKISVNGGAAVTLCRADGNPRGAAWGEEANIEVLSLKTGKVTVLYRGGYFGRYLPSGHLVFLDSACPPRQFLTLPAWTGQLTC